MHPGEVSGYDVVSRLGGKYNERERSARGIKSLWGIHRVVSSIVATMNNITTSHARGTISTWSLSSKQVVVNLAGYLEKENGRLRDRHPLCIACEFRASPMYGSSRALTES